MKWRWDLNAHDRVSLNCLCVRHACILLPQSLQSLVIGPVGHNCSLLLQLLPQPRAVAKDLPAGGWVRRRRGQKREGRRERGQKGRGQEREGSEGERAGERGVRRGEGGHWEAWRVGQRRERRERERVNKK